MKTLAILQNQWGPNATPEKVARIKAMPIDVYLRWTAMTLFSGCITGRRLETAFGKNGIGQIDWINASREMGKTSSAFYNADPQHIADVINYLRPDVVISFGRFADNGLYLAFPKLAEGLWVRTIVAPHPASRHRNINRWLGDIAGEWREAVSK